MPSILGETYSILNRDIQVLNLIITGMSSIHWYNNFDFYTKWMF